MTELDKETKESQIDYVQYGTYAVYVVIVCIVLYFMYSVLSTDSFMAALTPENDMPSNDFDLHKAIKDLNKKQNDIMENL